VFHGVASCAPPAASPAHVDFRKERTVDKPSIEVIQLQMAMAFGQGAGSMLANSEALRAALSRDDGVLIKRAARDWDTWQYAFLWLTRTAGQIAAARAAAEGKPEIDRSSIEVAIDSVLGVCPCIVRT
jgi:hypothetical protein